MKTLVFATFCIGLSLGLPWPQLQQRQLQDPGADDRQGGGYGAPQPVPDGYFQYVNVPAHKEYEFGWNRGNPHHYISRYEQSKDHRFRTRVRWGDKKGGYGEHYYEYNHGPSYGHDEHGGGYGKEAPVHVDAPAYAPPPPPKYPI